MSVHHVHILLVGVATLGVWVPSMVRAEEPRAICDQDCLRDFAVGAFRGPPLLAQLADGTILAYQSGDDGGQPCVTAIASSDYGKTWSKEQVAVRGLPDATQVLADRDGEVHIFSLKRPEDTAEKATGGEESRPLVGEMVGTRLDIWYARSRNQRTSYDRPRMIWKGYTGALNSVIQTPGGRILLPFSFLTRRTWRNRGEGLKQFTFTGSYDSTVLYSDDAGVTWKITNNLSIVVPDIVSAYGAVEPVALRLKDRIWMLIRGQTGRFYESFSLDDGVTWTRPKPSAIVSSDSPAGLVRLSDGRVVLLWNRCLRHPYAYGGRQVLHAAISPDEGRTWRGFREVARDKLRNEPPPKTGDHGTAYPFPIATRDDKILFRTGQGEGRVEIKLLDPMYLYQTRQMTDWRQKLEDWSVFGTRGVGLEASEGSGSGQALAIRKVDPEFPAAGVWNFPMGSKGTLDMRLRLAPETKGFRIGLTDHFSPPFDEEDGFYNVFNVHLGGPQGIYLPAGRWCAVRLAWDTRTGSCAILVDGRQESTVKALRVADGVCYVRLAAISDEPEKGGLWLDSAAVDVSDGF